MYSMFSGQTCRCTFTMCMCFTQTGTINVTLGPTSSNLAYVPDLPKPLPSYHQFNKGAYGNRRKKR